MKRLWMIILDPGDRVLQIGFAGLAILYFLSYTQAYNELLTFAVHDDALFVHQAESIASGNWLGEYDRLTLAKSPGYALFLAFGITTNLPYLWVLCTFHIVAVAFLLRRSRYLFPGMGLALLIAAGFLLFNPIFAGALRIYRFQLPAIVFMVFLGSLIGMYDPERRKSHWSIEAFDLLTVALSWGLLWYTREENLLYTCCLVVGLIGFLFVARSLVSPLWNLRFAASGLIGVSGFWLFIGGMNAQTYGRFVVCEKTTAPYPELMTTFFEIGDPERDPRLLGSTASREKIQSIASEVPEFQLMASNLIKFASRWRGTYLDSETLTIRQKPEGALTISHFEWAWMDAANASGYYENARTLQARYHDLDEAMETAIVEGRLSVDQTVLIQAGSYGLTRDDLSAIIRLLPRVYLNLIFTPSAILRDYRDLCARRPHDATRNKAVDLERWASVLRVRYLAEGDVESHHRAIDSISNRLWNKATTAFTYIAIPLIHLATPLALAALVAALLRRRWSLATAIALLLTTYLAYYLMLAALTVVNGYPACDPAYFLPAYTPLLLTSLASLSVLWTCLSHSVATDPSTVNIA